MTRQFIYSEYTGDHGGVDIIIDEDSLLKDYWEYWSGQMMKVGRSPLITEENCIQDFCVVHWATPLP